jgi:hypothetical protein
MRFRHGIERQVPESLRAEVLAAEMAGYDPWSPPRAAGDTVAERGGDPMDVSRQDAMCERDPAHAADVADAEHARAEEGDATLAEVVRRAEESDAAEEATAFAAEATAAAGEGARREGRPATARDQRAGPQNQQQGKWRRRAGAMAREATARLREELEAGEFVSGYSDESDSGSGSGEGEAGEAAGAGSGTGGHRRASRKRGRKSGDSEARDHRRRGEQGGGTEGAGASGA